MNVTADNLNSVMEIDHPIRVHADGTVTDAEPEIWPPDMHDGEIYSNRWDLLEGYSGQYGYNGPSMHASEFIGGRMARDILAEPGVYVAILDYPTDCGEPEGWAVARLKAA